MSAGNWKPCGKVAMGSPGFHPGGISGICDKSISGRLAAAPSSAAVPAAGAAPCCVWAAAAAAAAERLSASVHGTASAARVRANVNRVELSICACCGHGGWLTRPACANVV
eukprot:364782-Chlamydomonas_euryale.AAC.14